MHDRLRSIGRFARIGELADGALRATRPMPHPRRPSSERGFAPPRGEWCAGVNNMLRSRLSRYPSPGSRCPASL